MRHSRELANPMNWNKRRTEKYIQTSAERNTHNTIFIA